MPDEVNDLLVDKAVVSTAKSSWILKTTHTHITTPTIVLVQTRGKRRRAFFFLPENERHDEEVRPLADLDWFCYLCQVGSEIFLVSRRSVRSIAQRARGCPRSVVVVPLFRSHAFPLFGRGAEVCGKKKDREDNFWTNTTRRAAVDCTLS